MTCSLLLYGLHPYTYISLFTSAWLSLVEYLGDAIQIDMRDLSSSCTTEARRGGMRNSTRYDLGTTSAQHFLCFGCMLTNFNAHGYDLGTTLVRPWYDLSKAWAQAALSIGPAPRRVKNPLLGLRCGKLSFTWHPRHASLVQFLHAQLPFGPGSSCAGHGVVPTLCTRVYYVHVCA